MTNETKIHFFLSLSLSCLFPLFNLLISFFSTIIIYECYNINTTIFHNNNRIIIL